MRTGNRLDPLPAIVFPAAVALLLAGAGMVSGIIPGTSRQAATAAPDSRLAPAARMQAGGVPGARWIVAGRTCLRCGTVTAVYSVEQHDADSSVPGIQSVKAIRWNVIVEMDEGGSRTFSSAAEPTLLPGDRIVVVSRTVML